MKKISFKIKNIPVILYGEKSDKVYIVVHGKGGSKKDGESFAVKAEKLGYQTLCFDLPEHGEHIAKNYPCNAVNAVSDLTVIGEYIKENWSSISLYATSLGAYFSLLAYKDYKLDNCLFLSPILDMERLIKNMMKWFNVSEEKLHKEKEIPTPMDETLYWDYYCFVIANKIEKWEAKTTILYGSSDNLTEREVLDNFSKHFGCDVTVLTLGEHYFHTEKQLHFLDEWLDKHI